VYDLAASLKPDITYLSANIGLKPLAAAPAAPPSKPAAAQPAAQPDAAPSPPPAKGKGGKSGA